MQHRTFFGRFAKGAARVMGHPVAFILAVLIIVGWALCGPFFGYSDTWQLVINTSTTIVTFLMVFLIQNTQNRDSAAVQLKLDELIRAIHGAHNALLDLEELDAEDLERLRAAYEALARQARGGLEQTLGGSATLEGMSGETAVPSTGPFDAAQASTLVLFDQHGQVIWSAPIGVQPGGAQL